MESFGCAWRQWLIATGQPLSKEVDASALADLAAWMAANAVQYGKAAADKALAANAAAGAAIPETVLARAGVKVDAPPMVAKAAPVVAEPEQEAPVVASEDDWGAVPSVTPESVETMAEDAPEQASAESEWW